MSCGLALVHGVASDEATLALIGFSSRGRTGVATIKTRVGDRSSGSGHLIWIGKNDPHANAAHNRRILISPPHPAAGLCAVNLGGRVRPTASRKAAIVLIHRVSSRERFLAARHVLIDSKVTPPRGDTHTGSAGSSRQSETHCIHDPVF